ncbi:unnamed protein product, partial [Mesorhabditis belari]|uniref:Uncharacterized protein n=1 Tax=Mesorhabditis belari TaxID=2138241 RepID=A0AAF3ENI2_9BILA
MQIYLNISDGRHGGGVATDLRVLVYESSMTEIRSSSAPNVRNSICFRKTAISSASKSVSLVSLQALADHFDKYFIRGQIGQSMRDFVELMRVICVEDSRWWTHFDFISDSLKFQVIVRSWMESSEEFDPFNVQAVIRNLFIFLQKKRLEFEAEKIDGKKKLKMKTMIGNLMATEQLKVEQRQPSKSITIKEELSIDVGHEPSDDSESFSPRRSTRQSKTKSSEKRSGLRDRSSRRSIVEESESPPPWELGKVGKDDDSPRRRRTSGVSTSSPGQPSPQINVDDDFQFVKPMMKEKRHEDTPSTPTIRSRKSSSVLKETIGPFDRLFIPCDCPNSISSPISFCVRCGWSPGNAPHPYEPLWYIIERDNQVYVINTDAKQREIRCKFVKDDQNSLRILADTFNEFPEIEEEEEEDEDDMEIDEKDVGDLITDIELPPVLEMMSPLRRRSSVRATSRDSSRRSEASHASKMEEDGMDDGEEENEDGAQPKRLRKMSRKMRESLYGSEENDEQNPEAPLSSPLSSPTANQSLPKLDPESSPLREKPSENACTELEKFLEENEECDDPYAHLLDNVGPGWESNASDGDDDTSACDEIKRGALTETSFDERTATRRDSTGSKRAHNEITSHELNGDYWKPVTANREERNGRRGNRTLSPQNSLTASRGDSFDDLEVGVIPQLNPETHPEERDSLLSSDDGESGDEMFARRMKIPYANFIDQQPPFSVENNSSGKRNLHILKAASGIRPHWSSAVIGPAFARMKIDDSNKQSVEKVLRAVDVLHGWKKDEQEPIDVLECLTKPAPFPGRQIFAHLLSDSQRAGQALTGIPLSYVVKDDEEEEIQTAIYEGESDGGLSEMVKKTKWSDAGKIPRGVVGIGYKHTTSGDVCEEIVYPGDDEQDILLRATRATSTRS